MRIAKPRSLKIHRPPIPRETLNRLGNWRHGHGGHGRESKTYTCWSAMKRRCMNPKCPDYPLYGGRGITVDPRWLDFRNFLTDMGEKPEGKSLDRIESNGPYTKTNCRWATPVEQARNQRTNRLIASGGRTMPVAAWAEELGISPFTIYTRLNRGWSDDEAVGAARREASHAHR